MPNEKSEILNLKADLESQTEINKILMRHLRLLKLFSGSPDDNSIRFPIIIQVSIDKKISWTSANINDIIHTDNNASISGTCYSTLFGKSEPCIECPMNSVSTNPDSIHIQRFSEKHYKVSCIPVFDTKNALKSIIQIINPADDENLKFEHARYMRFNRLGFDWFCETDIYSVINYSAGRLPVSLGYDNSELAGHSLMEYVEEAEKIKIDALIQRILNKESIEEPLKLKLMDSDGSPRLVQIIAEPVTDESNEIHAIAFILRDICPNRKELKQLAVNDIQLGLALEAASSGMWDWDIEHNQIHYSNSWKRLLGYSENEELDNSLLEWLHRIHQDDRPSIQEAINKYISGEIESYSVEHRLRCKDGSFKWFLGKGMVTQKTKDNKPLRLIGIYVDIDTIKQSENLNRAAKESFISLFNSLDEMFFIINNDMKIIEVNQTALDRLDYEKEEIVGKLIIELHKPENYQEINNSFQLLQNRDDYTCSFPMLTKNDQVIEVESRIIQIQWQGQKAFICSSKDLTELKASEEKFAAAFNNRAVMMAITRLEDGRFIDVNQTMLDVMAIDKETALNATVYDFKIYENIGHRELMTSKLMQFGFVDGFELNYTMPDGEVKTGAMSASLMTFRGEHCLFTIINDVTETMAATKQLRKSEEKWSSLISNATDYIMIVNKNGQIKYINRSLVENVKTRAIIDQSIFDYVKQDYLQEISDAIYDAFYYDERSKVELELKINHEFRWFTFRVGFIKEGDKTTAVSIIASDITDMKAREAELQESRDIQSTLLTFSPDIIFSMNTKGEIQYMNRDMGDIPTEELIGASVFSLMPLERHEEYQKNIELVLSSGEQIQFESEVYGDEYYMTRFVPIKKQGKIDSIMAIATNITGRKRSEKEKERFIKQLAQSEKELKSINNEKDKFFSIIAHDLKGPFSGLLGLTEMMSEDLIDLSIREVQEMSNSLQKTAKNVYKLLENLLEWARLQQGRIEYKPTKFSLSAYITNTVLIVSNMAENKDIKIHHDIDDTLQVFADKAMVETVLRNLLTNAIKFTERKGSISISADRTENSIAIRIEDNGIGMDETLIKKLFRTDLKASTPGTEGEPSTGLGLILCKELVEKNNGSIEVKSAVGKGSSFTIYLPVKNYQKINNNFNP